MNELRIVLADDHALIRRGVRDLLATRVGWNVVGEATNGAEAVQVTLATSPQLAILDFSMPLLTGPEAAARIRAALPATLILILTMHDSVGVLNHVLRAGCDGLVLKGDADRTLLVAIDDLLRKRDSFAHDPSRSHKATRVPAPPRRSIPHPAVPPALTARENEVVRLLAEGLSTKQVAFDLQLSARTVESHRNNINQKMGFTSVVDLVRYAIRAGITAQP
jgi:DNA-binding NarL/FixJ family response regulator